MGRIDKNIVLSPICDDSGNQQHGGSCFVYPAVAEGSGDTQVFAIPSLKLGTRYTLDRDAFRHLDFHDHVILWRMWEVCVYQGFQKSSRVCFSRVDHSLAHRVPAAAVEHGARCIVNRMPTVRNAVGEH